MNPIQTVDYIRILPELVLTAFGIVVMMADPLLKPGASRKIAFSIFSEYSAARPALSTLS